MRICYNFRGFSHDPPLSACAAKITSEIAKEEGLITADKKDSQGLCFIGKVRLPKFLQQQLKPKKGDILVMPPDLPQYVKQKIPAGIDPEDFDQEMLDQICIPEKHKVPGQKNSGT